ncbi:MAG: amidohydrolase family protein, partial [Thiotrichales bacterium]|nr:amidohydrolase family protein [Thiotrichales bacterium]
SAMELVSRAIPEVDAAASVRAMQSAQSQLWQMGLTGIHDFDRRRSFEALQIMRKSGELGLRVLKNLPVEMLDEVVAVGLRSGFGDDLLRIGHIKVFADGALGPRTAAMLAPYEGEADNRGMLLADAEEVLEWGQKAALGGLGMTVHAIGDHANHEVLNAFEQLRAFEAANGLPARKHRIEHVQVLHPDDMARLAELKVAASMQPIHAPSDREAAEQYWGTRTQYAYAWKSQLEAGALLAFGSDAPVESPNPFFGLHAAVTRRDKAGQPDEEGWHPEQRLSLGEAVAAFTQGPAELAMQGQQLGRLAPGFLADLIVLNQDPYAIDPMELHALRPSATMVGGEWVWQA